MPELPAALVVPGRVARLGLREEPRSVDDDPGVITRRHNTVPFARCEAERHGSAVDVNDLGVRGHRGTQERRRQMVDGDTRPDRGLAVIEVSGYRRNSGFFEERNESGGGENRHVAAAESKSGVRRSDREGS